MCPQQPFYPPFWSQKSQGSPSQCIFTKVPSTLWLWLLFPVNIVNEIVVTENRNNIGSDYYVPTIVPLYSFYFTQKFVLSYAGAFHNNSVCVACCTFNVLEVRTITPNRFKNQSDGTLKILAHDCSRQQGLVKQKNIALHHWGFKAEFPKHFY